MVIGFYRILFCLCCFFMYSCSYKHEYNKMEYEEESYDTEIYKNEAREFLSESLEARYTVVKNIEDGCIICNKPIVRIKEKGNTKCCNALVHKNCAWRFIKDDCRYEPICPNDKCTSAYNLPIEVHVVHGENNSFEYTLPRVLESIFSLEDLGFRNLSFCEIGQHCVRSNGLLKILFGCNKDGLLDSIYKEYESVSPTMAFLVNLITVPYRLFISPVFAILSPTLLGISIYSSSSLGIALGGLFTFLGFSGLGVDVFLIQRHLSEKFLIRVLADGSTELIDQSNLTSFKSLESVIKEELTPAIIKGKDYLPIIMDWDKRTMDSE